MNYTDIKKLKDRLDKTSSTRDTSKDDLSISQMAETNGWDVLKSRIEKRIFKLLQPGMGKEPTDLETLGAITLAREFTIDELTGIINDVESTKSAKRIEKLNIEQEESNKGA
jgi:hypothetical protein